MLSIQCREQDSCFKNIGHHSTHSICFHISFIWVFFFTIMKFFRKCHNDPISCRNLSMQPPKGRSTLHQQKVVNVSLVLSVLAWVLMREESRPSNKSTSVLTTYECLTPKHVPRNSNFETIHPLKHVKFWQTIEHNFWCMGNSMPKTYHPSKHVKFQDLCFDAMCTCSITLGTFFNFPMIHLSSNYSIKTINESNRIGFKVWVELITSKMGHMSIATIVRNPCFN
jgi:hypothetical protein